MCVCVSPWYVQNTCIHCIVLYIQASYGSANSWPRLHFASYVLDVLVNTGRCWKWWTPSKALAKSNECIAIVTIQTGLGGDGGGRGGGFHQVLKKLYGQEGPSRWLSVVGIFNGCAFSSKSRF